MNTKEGLLRIGIPTGFGPNGVRKEAVKIARALLTGMNSENITEHWGKYYIPRNEQLNPLWSAYPGHQDSKWGVVISAEVSNLEYAKSIMLSFDYDDIYMIEAEKRFKYREYLGGTSPELYSYHNITIGDDHKRDEQLPY